MAGGLQLDALAWYSSDSLSKIMVARAAHWHMLLYQLFSVRPRWMTRLASAHAEDPPGQFHGDQQDRHA